jgi:hypothetical protein
MNKTEQVFWLLLREADFTTKAAKGPDLQILHAKDRQAVNTVQVQTRQVVVRHEAEPHHLSVSQHDYSGLMDLA